MMAPRTRVLFVSEAVTLAQVVRLVVLARSLPTDRYEVHFASARFDDLMFGGSRFVRWPIRSIDPAVVERTVARGGTVWDEDLLMAYVDDDRRVLDNVRPALVVGDLRLSLTVAAPLAGVPHAALVNAYWSPHAVRDEFPVPDHPIVKVLGEQMAARYFPKALPYVLARAAAPLNTVRRRHGLPGIGDLRQALTHGDHTLFPDVPGLVPTAGGPGHHHYLGPVLWAPELPRPQWWDRLDPHRPTVYVTMGSSGRADRLPVVLAAIERLGLQAIVATAGRGSPTAVPPHVFVADYVPGHLAARRAFAVVSNGGSTTGYQALAEGRPVVGVAHNLDQYLAMTAIQAAGAGTLLRAGSVTAEEVTSALGRVLHDPAPTQAAEALARAFTTWNAPQRFRSFVESVVLAGTSWRAPDEPRSPSPHPGG